MPTKHAVCVPQLRKRNKDGLTPRQLAEHCGRVRLASVLEAAERASNCWSSPATPLKDTKAEAQAQGRDLEPEGGDDKDEDKMDAVDDAETEGVRVHGKGTWGLEGRKKGRLEV